MYLLLVPSPLSTKPRPGGGCCFDACQYHSSRHCVVLRHSVSLPIGISIISESQAAAARESAVARELPASALSDGSALWTLAQEHCRAFQALAPERPLAPEGVRHWASLCSGSEGAHFAVLAAEAAYRRCGVDCDFLQAFACEAKEDDGRIGE
jgi:hypothetical protein